MRRITDLLVYGALRLLLGLLRVLPYGPRVQLGSWLFARTIAPLAGYSARIDANLRLVFPDMPRSERRRIGRATARNIGRMAVELFSPEGLRTRALAAPVSGPGWEAMQQARAAGRPVILVSGHFGNYDVIRAGSIAAGFRVGGIYQPLRNTYFHRFYLDRIGTIGQPLFPRGRRGMGQMLRFLRSGGSIALLIDQHIGGGEALTFMGHTALTALSAAELALRHDALLVPCYGIRQADGLSFHAVYEAPIPHSTPAAMTQALNDSLEAQVRAHVDQWMWIHRRWKGGG